MKLSYVLFAAAIQVTILAPTAVTQSIEDRTATVRQLNADLVNMQEEVTANRAVPRSFDRRNAVGLIRQRGQAMLELIRHDPQQALDSALPEETLRALRRTYPEAVDDVEQFGEWSGSIEAVILDDFEGETSRTETRLNHSGGETLLHFAGDSAPPPQCTHEAAVEGMRLAGEMAVRKVTTSNTTTSSASACTPAGSQRTLVILAKFPGYADKFTPEHARNVIFGNTGTRSLNTYWQEVSAGKTSASGTVVGWITLSKIYPCTDYVNMRLAAISAADKLVDLTQFTRILIFFPNPGSCSFGGVSTVGCTSIATSRGTSYASISQMVADYATTVDRAVQLTSHEAGHGLGLRHAASRDFGAQPLGPLGSTGTVSTYGDNFDTMGYWNLGHYSAPQKSLLGWWQSGSQTKIVQSNSTHTIAPSELAAIGTQALKVQRGTGNNAWLWLEYRRPIGLFDTALPATSGLLIHYQDSTNAGLTHLLDYSAGSANWKNPVLPPGSTWIDPYSDLSITVLSTSASAATVTINYGPKP